METGKEYTIADDKGSKRLLISEKEGVFIIGAYSDIVKERRQIFGKATNILQSRNGDFVIIASEKKVMVYSLKDQAPVTEKEFNYIHSITLSPAETYLQILDKINVNEGRTLLFSLPELKEIVTFHEDQYTGYFNKEHFPLVRFSADDSHYFKYANKHIDVYRNKDEKVLEIESGLVDFFQVSPVSKGEEFFIASIHLDKKTSEGKCELFTHKQYKEPIYSKHIKKAEEVKIKFSPVSNQFLMELQTYFDPTGKSYYGEFGLFIYNDEKNKIASIKTEKGPVHDFSWHASGEKFIVISGFMPAVIKMFNKNNEPIFEFGKKHRNTIVWGNLGRFLCLAGFGNLNGEMEIWDLETLKQIGYCKSSSASYCQWSLDDRKIITAIVTPRLRVDNCYKVFSYTGKELVKIGYDETELYGAHWIRTEEKENKARGLSPGRKIEVEKKEEGKFKSFAASLNFSSLTFEEKKDDKPKLAPGQFPDDDIPKKKPRKKKIKEVDQLAPS